MNKYLLCILSGILIGLSFRYTFLFILIWVAFLPFFIAIQNAKPKLAILLGLITGTVTSFFILAWIIPTTTSYMGQSVFGGVLAFLVIALLYSVIFMVFAFFYSWLKISFQKASLLSIIAVPALWAGLELIKSATTITVPWMTFYMGYILTQIPEFIQFAEFIGVFGISFLIIAVNYIFYLSIKTKKLSFLYSGIGILIFLFVSGWFMMSSITEGKTKTKVAMIQENIPAKQRWNKEIGDSIVEKYYLAPLREAVKYNPNIVLWTETAIPWTFRNDDDLVYEILKTTWSTRAAHIIGIHSDVPNKPNSTYNTAYYIQPDGAITGQYNKMYPLSFLEKPLIEKSIFGDVMLPFFNQSIQNIEPGISDKLLKSPHGLIGISICNESSLGFHSRNKVNNGANFLMVMSNDAWFAGTKFPQFHFMHMIMMAVENRRDVVANSNRGYSGFVDASGKVSTKSISAQPKVITGKISKRTNITWYTSYGDVFTIVCIVYFILFTLITFLITNNKRENL